MTFIFLLSSHILQIQFHAGPLFWQLSMCCSLGTSPLRYGHSSCFSSVFCGLEFHIFTKKYFWLKYCRVTYNLNLKQLSKKSNFGISNRFVKASCFKNSKKHLTSAFSVMYLSACFEKQFASRQRLNLAKAIPNNDMCNIASSKRGRSTLQYKMF